ncbi:hypothetical protein, partial [Pantoea sp. BAV 3049]|uniref:hypothetical protein n=1 Tax=Pantoea sp. BAV 3049 TaxID=2654188 RepID=UPI001E46B097
TVSRRRFSRPVPSATRPPLHTGHLLLCLRYERFTTHPEQLMGRSIGEFVKVAKHFLSYFVEFMRFYLFFF